MTEDEERPPGRDRRRRRPECLRQLGRGQLEVEDGDEVERERRGRDLEHVGDDPLDLDATTCRELGRLRERDVREVDTRHPPSLFGEPDRVSAFAAGDVERTAGTKPGDLGGESAVRLCRPEELLLRVAAVPVLARETRPDGCSRTAMLGHGRSRAAAAASAIKGTLRSKAAARASSAPSSPRVKRP